MFSDIASGKETFKSTVPTAKHGKCIIHYRIYVYTYLHPKAIFLLKKKTNHLTSIFQYLQGKLLKRNKFHKKLNKSWFWEFLWSNIHQYILQQADQLESKFQS